ncbi:hypothetical protein Cs7R123_43400 [Catellatospora sp. TT07R-123]|uniref:hypothetical protein n=1 Tax=Catellatospora sp. TT07R-123 TaxID=2733863 RepID=UPI001B02A4B3|nr:hypothetical protein [Catellatospora sp. TT07R-123]GHJ46998.1 hypothetical protein Cs7R123_43400 [Catellatospora sp. TT07R-123]
MTRRILAAAAAAALAVLIPAAPAHASVAPGGFTRATVACPTGKVAVAGGTQVAGEGSRDFRTVLQESSPSGSLWLIAARNNDSTAHTIGLYAVCATAPSGYEVVRKDAVVTAGGFLRTYAVCPSGKVVLGGGAQVVGSGSADFRTVIQETGPDSAMAGALKLWRTAVSNNDSVAHTIGFFAVCANPPTGYEVVRRDVSVAAGGFLRTTANCPAGKAVLGGGGQVIDSSGANYQVVTQESAPGDAGGFGLFLTAMRNNGTATRTVALLAVCATSLPGYQIVPRYL